MASPGSVLVGEATRRATDAAVRYEPAGFHELKGKAEPLRTVPCAAGGGGSQRLDAGRGSRGAVRGSRPRAADAQGAVPLQLRPPDPAARDGDRHRRGRQVPAVVGVREVHRRAGRQRLVAPGSLPVVRRRGDLLGAGRHDADAGRVGRGRGPGDGRRQARRHRRRVRAGPGRAPLDRAPARSAARARRPAHDRAGRPVRRLAAVRRADVGRRPGRAGLRGPALGRLVAAGLRRLPARVVPRPPDLRARAEPARAGRAAADLGCRPAQLQLAVPRAAHRRRDGAAARGPGAGSAATGCRDDPGPGRGHPAVRGRDGADAAGPGPAREGRRRLPPDRPDRRPRGARDPARPDRRPPGRPGRRPSDGWSRTLRCWASRSRRPPWPRCPA